MFKIPDIPEDSILGINYSGMHDTSIAIVDKKGCPLFACSLERVTRRKQDGRWIDHFGDAIPWDRIDRIALSTSESFPNEQPRITNLLTDKLEQKYSDASLKHQPDFYKFISKLPKEAVFVGHQVSHAAAAYFQSGYKNAHCLCYDGGMLNEPYFGGLFSCNDKNIDALDLFDSRLYKKITTLYTFITGLLGFMPLRHEGKLTGLAAYGDYNKKAFELVEGFYYNDYSGIESTLVWDNLYNNEFPPSLEVNQKKIAIYKTNASLLRSEDIAYALQAFTEAHVKSILNRINETGVQLDRLCLSGGLFANVKLNQRISEFVSNQLFVAPAMTDDGTALGAALYQASQGSEFGECNRSSVYLGPKFSQSDAQLAIEKYGINVEHTDAPVEAIVEILKSGSEIAIFQSNMEFGPRALGHRSIIAASNKYSINEYLNRKLKRTEFMPFAPMILDVDANFCFSNFQYGKDSSCYMTVTFDCTDEYADNSKAAIHVDKTARPQVLTQKNNPLLYDVLNQFKNATGIISIVNTSFNVHEEPIVCTPEDALRGFFQSGINYLYIENVGIVKFVNNLDAAFKILNDKIEEDKAAHKSIIAGYKVANVDLVDKFHKLLNDIRVRDEELKTLRIDIRVRDEELEILRRDTIVREAEIANLRNQ